MMMMMMIVSIICLGEDSLDEDFAKDKNENNKCQI